MAQIGVYSGWQYRSLDDTFWQPSAFPLAPAVQSDHFDKDVLDAKWIPFHITGNFTPVVVNHHLKTAIAGVGAGHFSGYFQVLPAGNFTITIKCGLCFEGLPGFLSDIGIMLLQDAALNPDTCDLILYILSAQWPFFASVYEFSDYNTWAATHFAVQIGYLQMPYLRMRRNGGNLFFDFSNDGINWTIVWTIPQPFVPKEFGICMRNNSLVNAITTVDFIDYHNADVGESPVGRKAGIFYV